MEAGRRRIGRMDKMSLLPEGVSYSDLLKTPPPRLGTDVKAARGLGET
jgi:hypothetical protein